MSDKLRFWASFALFAAIGAITLLNLSNQHERAASKEVVIDMPGHIDLSAYGTPVPQEVMVPTPGGWNAPLGN